MNDLHECRVCGSTSFHETDLGDLVCESCGTQSLQSRGEMQDEDDMQHVAMDRLVRRKAPKKAKEARKPRREPPSLEKLLAAQQHVLQTWAATLARVFSLHPSLHAAVYRLWFAYLDKRKAHTKLALLALTGFDAHGLARDGRLPPLSEDELDFVRERHALELSPSLLLVIIVLAARLVRAPLVGADVSSCCQCGVLPYFTMLDLLPDDLFEHVQHYPRAFKPTHPPYGGGLDDRAHDLAQLLHLPYPPAALPAIAARWGAAARLPPMAVSMVCALVGAASPVDGALQRLQDMCAYSPVMLAGLYGLVLRTLAALGLPVQWDTQEQVAACAAALWPTLDTMLVWQDCDRERMAAGHVAAYVRRSTSSVAALHSRAARMGWDTADPTRQEHALELRDVFHHIARVLDPSLASAAGVPAQVAQPAPAQPQVLPHLAPLLPPPPPPPPPQQLFESLLFTGMAPESPVSQDWHGRRYSEEDADAWGYGAFPPPARAAPAAPAAAAAAAAVPATATGIGASATTAADVAAANATTAADVAAANATTAADVAAAPLPACLPAPADGHLDHEARAYERLERVLLIDTSASRRFASTLSAAFRSATGCQVRLAAV